MRTRATIEKLKKVEVQSAKHYEKMLQEINFKKAKSSIRYGDREENYKRVERVNVCSEITRGLAKKKGTHSGETATESDAGFD